MNHLVMKLNTSMTVGDRPMVLLPLDIYEKITKNFGELDSKTLQKDIKKAGAAFLAVASESSLSKDWFKPEEEKAWKNL